MQTLAPVVRTLVPFAFRTAALVSLGEKIDTTSAGRAHQRDGRKRLAEIAAEHPEAFAPERLPTTEARLRRALKVDPDPLVTLSLRVRASTRAELKSTAKADGISPATLGRRLIERALGEESAPSARTES